MATRQYIGARYVPKFFENPDGTNTWAAGYSYENLIIVQYHNDSYTSKKPVPASVGNPADNPEYWVLTGNFNGQVAELEGEIGTFDGRITENANAIAAEVTARENADTALGERITANADAITAEATARENADNALSERVTVNADAVATEATARAEADTALGERIDSNDADIVDLQNRVVNGTADVVTKNVDAENGTFTGDIIYKTPQVLDNNFNYVTMKNSSGDEYKVLVDNGKPLTQNKFLTLGFCVVDYSVLVGGNCAFVKTLDNEFYIFDLGVNTIFDSIKAQLEEAGCTKIAGVIISHYHGDHISDVALWKSAFDMTETIFYLPLTTTKHPESETALAYFTQTFPSNTFIYPENNSTYTFNNGSNDTFNISFNNCGQSVFNYYESLTTQNYNDYSMCAYVEHGNDVIGYMGDISSVSANYMYNNDMAKKLSAMTCPHHGYDGTYYKPIINVWRPEFIYASNTGDQYRAVGMRNPVICISHALGAKIAMSAENKKCVYVCSTSEGLLYGNFYESPISWYSDQPQYEIYVDSSYTGDIENGNPDTPYRTLTRACNKPNNYPTIIHLVHMDNIPSLTLVYTNNLQIIGEGDTPIPLGYLTVTNASHIRLNNLSFTDCDATYNTALTLNNCTCSNPMYFAYSSGLKIINCSTTATNIDSCFIIRYCSAYVNNLSGTGNKCLVYCAESSITGTLPQANFTRGTENARLIWWLSGSVNIANRDQDITVSLPNFWYVSESYKRPLLYDTAVNKFATINSDHTLSYLTFES